MFSSKYCDTFKYSFSYGTPAVAAFKQGIWEISSFLFKNSKYVSRFFIVPDILDSRKTLSICGII